MFTNLRQRFLGLSGHTRVAVLAAAAAVLLVVATASWRVLASDENTVDGYIAKSGLSGQDELRIGVFKDEPLMGFATTPDSARLRDHEGFDIEIARSLAGYLGFGEDSVELIETQVQNRSSDLNENVVHVVVASYSITPGREEEVDFAGPYLRSQPEVLMRADRAKTMDQVTFRQLDEMGKRLCTTGSSTSEAALRENQIHGFDGVAVSANCVDGLLNGTYDAFMLDDVVLAGFKSRHSDQLALVDLVFDQTEYYGIAVANGDEPLRQVVGNFLMDSYERGENGSWQQAWNRTLGRELGKKRQPKPNEYVRLRDYRDRIQAEARLFGQAEPPVPLGSYRLDPGQRAARRGRRR
jgi:glutamate transport system substrate-binding protein